MENLKIYGEFEGLNFPEPGGYWGRKSLVIKPNASRISKNINILDRKIYHWKYVNYSSHHEKYYFYQSLWKISCQSVIILFMASHRLQTSFNEIFSFI